MSRTGGNQLAVLSDGLVLSGFRFGVSGELFFPLSFFILPLVSLETSAPLHGIHGVLLGFGFGG